MGALRTKPAPAGQGAFSHVLDGSDGSPEQPGVFAHVLDEGQRQFDSLSADQQGRVWNDDEQIWQKT